VFVECFYELFISVVIRFDACEFFEEVVCSEACAAFLARHNRVCEASEVS